jgi:predicted hotdog family 3-hydroxylacyl-ACP dehydratase
MSKEIYVKDLIQFLPHRPPMVWIDRIIEVGQDYKGLVGTCIVKMDENGLYFLSKSKLRASSTIEFTAQSFGYLKAAYQVIHNFKNPPTKTLLTGVRSCESYFSEIDFKQNDELEIRIRVLKEILPVTYIRGEIYFKGQDKLLGSAEIQVYVE